MLEASFLAWSRSLSQIYGKERLKAAETNTILSNKTTDNMKLSFVLFFVAATTLVAPSDAFSMLPRSSKSFNTKLFYSGAAPPSSIIFDGASAFFENPEDSSATFFQDPEDFHILTMQDDDNQDDAISAAYSTLSLLSGIPARDIMQEKSQDPTAAAYASLGSSTTLYKTPTKFTTPTTLPATAKTQDDLPYFMEEEPESFFPKPNELAQQYMEKAMMMDFFFPSGETVENECTKFMWTWCGELAMASTTTNNNNQETNHYYAK